MAKQKKTDKPVENVPQEYTPQRENLRKRVRKHVSDKSDKITDQDIRNVKVDSLPPTVLRPDTGEIVDNAELPEDPNSKKEDLPGKTTDGHTKHVTPWDVVSE